MKPTELALKIYGLVRHGFVATDPAGRGRVIPFTTSGELILGDGSGIAGTRGSVLYQGASGWATLPPGTAGDVLTSNGAGADPSYQEAGGAGSAWSVLTNGDAVAPELMWDSNGDVIMTEILR